MADIQKPQNIAAFNYQHSKSFVDNALRDKKLLTYACITGILNVSSKILSFAAWTSFIGSLASTYFNVPILSLSTEILRNIAFKSSMTNLALIIPKVVIDQLGQNRAFSILENNLPKDFDLQNATIVLTDKEIKIINNLTNEKIAIKFDI
ncbi:MAG: hypothetical protein KR126chlam4_00248 [Candidatus Anoxychlamydiales bacterium]|nr:hypothetical protein [Candidatus Anoxychlamydiales bacterium]NGX40426.1 hypothetical protein [Candidatus Anoxychlamydiales bacterium]